MTLVVAVPQSGKDRSALYLAAMLARSGGQTLRLVSVVPEPARSTIPSASDRQFEVWARRRGSSAVAAARRAAAEVCPDVPSEAVFRPARTIAKGLQAEAEEAGASAIVLGSGTEGAWGRIVLSSTSDRLLHPSQVPVALAPRGYGTVDGATVDRVTCAFRGDERSRRVLARTAELARTVGARLRVATFGVGGQTVEPETVAEAAPRERYVGRVRTSQLAAIEMVGAAPEGSTEEEVGTGATWRAALDSLQWLAQEVLVVGSSSEGGSRRVFLGTHAAKILRHAPVPVILVP